MKNLNQTLNQPPVRVPGADDTKNALEVLQIQIENFRKLNT